MRKKSNVKDFEKKFLECDKRFNTIFKLTSAASKIIRDDLTIIKVNGALSELLGYPAEEIEGTKILDHVCEEYKEHWHNLQMALWSKQVPFFKLEACLYKKDRTLVWVKVTTILYKDEGETFGFTVLDDITSLKQFEESEKRLNIALKNSKMAAWELDLNSKVVFRSEGHDEIFGYDGRQERWTINDYFLHIWEEDLPRFKTAINSFSDASVMDIQVRLKTKDGMIKWVNFQCKAEINQTGRFSKMSGTIHDITKDKLIERHKDDFISIASHELKTPITSLKTSLQLLDRMNEGLADKIKAMIVQANKSIDKIVALVDDLLNAGKAYNEQLNLKKTTFNLYKAIEECCEQLGVADSYQILVEGPTDMEINADAERIERVIINFLSNAIKYAANSKQFHILIEQSTTLAKVSVIDQGPGIPPEKLPLLFDRYYQADSHEGHYSGLGLGLFISAEIIKKHGGEIGVDSEQGRGSTFWFTVPL